MISPKTFAPHATESLIIVTFYHETYLHLHFIIRTYHKNKHNRAHTFLNHELFQGENIAMCSVQDGSVYANLYFQHTAIWLYAEQDLQTRIANVIWECKKEEGRSSLIFLIPIWIDIYTSFSSWVLQTSIPKHTIKDKDLMRWRQVSWLGLCCAGWHNETLITRQ